MDRDALQCRLAGEQGIALIISLMAITLMMALGMTLVLTMTTEVKIASSYHDGLEALYAADAAVERTIRDVLTVADWSRILDGTVTSAFVDGPPGGTRTLADGRTLNLTEATSMVRCGKRTACSDGDMTARTEERPWGANNPRWQLYAYGPMSDMLPTKSIDSRAYVVVWIADDLAESDGNPLNDGLDSVGCAPGAECINLGKGVISVLAHAYGPGGVVRIIEATLSRSAAGVRVLSWRELR